MRRDTISVKVNWEAVGATATALAALASLAVLVVAVYQLRLLRRQVFDAAAGVAAAERAAQAATDAAVEASRGRADATAPQVIVNLDKPSWPPFLDRTHTGMPMADGIRLLSPESIRAARLGAPGEEFLFDRDSTQFLWFVTSGQIINEGRGSARIRLDGEGHFDDAGQGDEVLLRPGEERGFRWATGLSLGEWAARHATPVSGRGFLSFTIMDFQEHGVIDHVFVELGARPLEPVPSIAGGWRLSEDGSGHIGVTIYPTRRTYRWDWGRQPPREPPWARTD